MILCRTRIESSVEVEILKKNYQRRSLLIENPMAMMLTCTCAGLVLLKRWLISKSAHKFVLRFSVLVEQLKFNHIYLGSKLSCIED